MKKISILLTLWIFVFLFVFFLKDIKCSDIDKQITKQLVQDTFSNVFKAGERIKFGVYSTAIKVGEGELFYDGVVGEGADSAQAVDFIIRAVSVVDEEKILGTLDFVSPIKVNRKVKLFGREELIAEEYSKDRKSVLINKTINGKAAKEESVSSSNELNNVLLLLYRLRNDPNLSVGKSYKINLPTQNFDLSVVSIKKINTKFGTFDAFYLESKPSKYRIWLSTGKDHLPLRIQGLIAGGILYLVALEVENLQ